MKSLLILSVMRSGSTWVSSLTNSTGQLGCAREWLKPAVSESDTKLSAEEHFQSILKKGTTSNSVFSIKIMPDQLYAVESQFGYDLIQRCLKEQEVSIVLLERRDLLGAAISATRAAGTREWEVPKNGSAQRIRETLSAQYDAGEILQNLHYINESVAFWRSYLAVRGLRKMLVFYEDVIDDWRGYVNDVAAEMQVSVDLGSVSADRYRIQRDDLTEEWRQRFLKDSEALHIEKSYDVDSEYPRTLGNFARLMNKKRLVYSPREQTVRRERYRIGGALKQE